MNPLNEKQKRERKFLLVLPLLTLPFLCLAFWALGGGKGSSPIEYGLQKGLNLSLPEARIEAVELDKLESYEQAERKALKLKEQRRMDPFAEFQTSEKSGSEDLFLSTVKVENSSLEEAENSVRDKLSDLEKLITDSEPAHYFPTNKAQAIDPVATDPTDDPDLERLEAMMASVINPEMEDPELKQIDAMLEKLLDVQHPQRVQERMNEIRAVRDPRIFEVSTVPFELENGGKTTGSPGSLHRVNNGFYTLEEDRTTAFSEIMPAISAKITIDQEVVDGASIDLELAQPIYIKGQQLPIGTALTGICSLDGERLNIQVKSIRKGNLIIPVNLEAIDLDALPGIRIPNAITREAVKKGAGNGIQSMNMMNMSNSWEAQASMAGMEAVKGIFSKKAKLIKVKVKAGHPLLLADRTNH